jgi:hypothetical protein
MTHGAAAFVLELVAAFGTTAREHFGASRCDFRRGSGFTAIIDHARQRLSDAVRAREYFLPAIP